VRCRLTLALRFGDPPLNCDGRRSQGFVTFSIASRTGTFSFLRGCGETHLSDRPDRGRHWAVYPGRENAGSGRLNDEHDIAESALGKG
jgi:hypothetical protein